MFSSTAKIATLFLGLSQLSSIAAQPLDAATTNAGSFIISHDALTHFPGAKGDLAPFDVAIEYHGYNSSMQSWLQSLDPAKGKTDEEKARIMTEAAYAKAFNEADPDMAGDRDLLLAAVAGNATHAALEKRQTSFRTASAHAVAWGACSSFFACVSGTTCSFSINVGKAPRSQCQSQGGQNCCISWSDYNVKVGFFSRTWTNCNQDVKNEKLSKASCEGHGDDSYGGDVCLSNRGTGCT